MPFASLLNRRQALAGCLALAGTACGCSSTADMPASPAVPAQPLQAFADALRQVLRPVGASRPPVVAVLAHNAGTEITDFLVPHALLDRSGVARVQAVALRGGVVQLVPALQVQVPCSLDDFDAQHPQGADCVVVPAMLVDDEPVLLAWLRRQAARGAAIVGVCSGARVLGQAGLLDGRRFTGHWHDRATLLARHPTAMHVPSQRYLIDKGVATTTGVSASIPVSLALVEALGGTAAAQALAQQIDMVDWAPDHTGQAFGLTPPRVAVYLANRLRGWVGGQMLVCIADGMDDLRLALAMDAWSRTHRLAGLVVEPMAASPGQGVCLASGLAVAGPSASAGAAPLPALPLYADVPPARVLDAALCDIGQRYGAGTRDWVALEMEYTPVDASRCRVT